MVDILVAKARRKASGAGHVLSLFQLYSRSCMGKRYMLRVSQEVSRERTYVQTTCYVTAEC